MNVISKRNSWCWVWDSLWITWMGNMCQHWNMWLQELDCMGVRSLVSIVLKPMIPSCFGSSYVWSLLIKSGNLKGFDKHPEQVYNPSWNPKVISNPAQTTAAFWVLKCDAIGLPTPRWENGQLSFSIQKTVNACS